MLKTGQRVRHKTRGVQGVVLEIDGATAYLEADNGVEMQFPVADLEPDVPKPAAVAAAAKAAADTSRHDALLARMPESVVGLAAVAFARDPKSPRNGWADLPSADKLGWVARMTGLSLEQLAALARDGKTRQIEAHAASTRSRGRG